MVRLTGEKLQLLKKAFTEDAMQPGQAAETIGVTYATAKRWYDKWSDEVKVALEKRLLPSLEASVKREVKKHPQPKRKSV